jgi:hypothetical protein
VRGNILWTCLLIAAAAVPCRSAEVYDSTATHEYCGTNIPPDEAVGTVALPEGDVFCPLLADPKATHSYVAYVRGSSTSPFGTDLASFGIGDHFGLVRWGGPRPGDGIQIGLEGSVFAQLDLNTESHDLINADYVLGLPVSWRWRMLSGRLRAYHQSSHLGDEFVLRSRIPRENFAFESGEAIVSVDAGPVRFYAGGEYVIHSFPVDLAHWIAHGGAELRQRAGAIRLGSFATVRLVAGGDVKSVEYIDWETAVSGVAGFEFSAPHAAAHAARSWSVLGHYYYGPSPYGQFFRSDVTYYGVGVHFAL